MIKYLLRITTSAPYAQIEKVEFQYNGKVIKLPILVESIGPFDTTFQIAAYMEKHFDPNALGYSIERILIPAISD